MLTRFLLISLLALLPYVSDAQPFKAGFNDEDIEWVSLEDGLAMAKRDSKPILVLVHATWCPVCREYRSVFFDERIVAKSRDFVFVIVDEDLEPKTAEKLAPDGGYVPRTLFLSQNGKLQNRFNSGRQDFRYFLPPDRPEPLLRLMQKATN